MIRLRNNRHIQPRNQRLPDVARRTIESLSQVIKQQYDNAIYVNGLDSILYITKESGRQCSCSMSSSVRTVLDPLGNMREDMMASFLSDTDVFIKSPTGDKSDYVMHTDKLDRDSSSLEPLYPDKEFSSDSFPTVFGDTPACCVCHGIGYVGGFTPFGGDRIVLDSSEPTLESDGGYIDAQFYPNRVLLEDGATVTWLVTFPKKIARLEAFQLWDNETVVSWTDFKVYLELNSNWVEVTPFNLSDFFTGFPQKIKVEPLIDTLRFSHLEIQFSYVANRIRIDFPNLPNELSYNVYDNLSQLNLVIPPSVSYLHRYSVVREALHGSLWRLTSISYTGDALNNQHGWNATARLIQPYELVNSLPTIDNGRSLTGLPLQGMKPQKDFHKDSYV